MVEREPLRNFDRNTISGHMKTHLLVVLFVLPVFSQTSPVIVAGVQIRLGMAKESVLARFNADGIKITLTVPGENSYSITAKTLNTWDLAGILTFDHDRLTRI